MSDSTFARGFTHACGEADASADAESRRTQVQPQVAAAAAIGTAAATAAGAATGTTIGTAAAAAASAPRVLGQEGQCNVHTSIDDTNRRMPALLVRMKSMKKYLRSSWPSCGIQHMTILASDSYDHEP